MKDKKDKKFSFYPIETSKLAINLSQVWWHGAFNTALTGRDRRIYEYHEFEVSLVDIVKPHLKINKQKRNLNSVLRKKVKTVCSVRYGDARL